LNGPAEGIKAIQSIASLAALKKYYLLPATLGEMHQQLRQPHKAKQYFLEALTLTQSASEKKLLQQKIERLGNC
jgi:predicted RNA polymerase sigma factor